MHNNSLSLVVVVMVVVAALYSYMAVVLLYLPIAMNIIHNRYIYRGRIFTEARQGSLLKDKTT